MAGEQVKREIFVASFEALDKMNEMERIRVFAQMAHDATVAANKIRAARGEPLFTVTSVDEMVESYTERHRLQV